MKTNPLSRVLLVAAVGFTGASGTSRCTADDIYGNRTATPTRLTGDWVIQSIVESSERYGVQSDSAKNESLRLRFSKDRVEVHEAGQKATTWRYFVAPQRNAFFPSQSFYYEVDANAGVFSRLTVDLKRYAVLTHNQMVECDNLSVTLSSSDTLFSDTYVPPRSQTTRQIYFRKVRAEFNGRLLPQDTAEQVFPEDIFGQWTMASSSGDGHELTLTLDERGLEFSAHGTSRQQAFDYVPGEHEGWLMLPLDGGNNLFVVLPVTLAAGNTTLQLQLVPKVRRWLADILPEKVNDTATLTFNRRR